MWREEDGGGVAEYGNSGLKMIQVYYAYVWNVMKPDTLCN